MNSIERAKKSVELLKAQYPEAKCSLDYSDPFQLLIATRLSAQCTDARVNMVTPALFARFPDAKSFMEADLGEVEQLIKTCGLYKTKAKDLISIGKDIYELKLSPCACIEVELPKTLPDWFKASV